METVQDFENLSLFENPYALRVLIFIQNNPGKRRGELYESVSGAKKTLQNRIDELVGAGLIDEVESSTHKRGRILYLTPLGANVASSAVSLSMAASGDIESSDSTINHGTSAQKGVWRRKGGKT